MSDTQLRRLERAWQATGAPDDFNKLIAAIQRIQGRAEANRAISGLITSLDIPYRLTESITWPEIHQIPVLKHFDQADVRRAVMTFALDDIYLNDVSDSYTAANTVFVDPPPTAGDLITYISNNHVYCMTTLVETINEALKDQAAGREMELEIADKRRAPIGFHTQRENEYSFYPQSYYWRLKLRTRPWNTYDCTLNLIRNPFTDTLEFIVETPLNWGSINEVVGARLSGERYQVYGLQAPDPEENPEDYDQYEAMDDFDQIASLQNAIQLISDYMQAVYDL